jgi:anti-anti-sigma factor
MSIIHRELARDVDLLKPNRPLNGRWAKELELKFQEAFHRGARWVVVDLQDVPFVDCLGLAALVAGYKLFGSKKQNVVLVGLQDQPTLLLELTMFDRIFIVFDSVAEVMGSQSFRQEQVHQPAPKFAPQPA